MKRIMSGTKQKLNALKMKGKNFFIRHRELSGITVIELVLILVIIIALLLIFKNQLISLINSIFERITSESAGI